MDSRSRVSNSASNQSAMQTDIGPDERRILPTVHAIDGFG